MEEQLTTSTGENTTLLRNAWVEALLKRLRTHIFHNPQLIKRSISSAPIPRRRLQSQKLAFILFFSLVLIPAGCSSNSAVTPLAPTSTVTSDEQVAGGPL